MTHEESSEARAEAVERIWLSKHVAVGGVRGCRHASVAWLHTCDVWSGLCSLEALVGTEGDGAGFWMEVPGRHPKEFPHPPVDAWARCVHFTPLV